MLLFLRNLAFILIVPGTVAVYAPLYVARDEPIGSTGALIAGSVLILLGAAIYFACQWNFAIWGRGTPAPIDAPRKFVSRGLYRYVRSVDLRRAAPAARLRPRIRGLPRTGEPLVAASRPLASASKLTGGAIKFRIASSPGKEARIHADQVCKRDGG